MWTITGATTEYTIAAVDNRLDLVAWGPIGVSDGPSPYAYHGKVQYMLPGDVAAVEYAPDGLRPFLGADLAIAGHVLTWRLHSVGLVDEVSATSPARGDVDGGEPRAPAVDGGDVLCAVFVDDVSGIEVELRWRFVAGTDVVERWATVRNGGAEALTLLRMGSAGFNIPAPEGVTVSYLWGQWSQEFTPASTVLSRGRWEIGSSQGVTGHQFSPTAAIENGTAAYGIGLAWSGSWGITVDSDVAGLARVRAGRSLDGAPITLSPGESVVSPVAAGVHSADGRDGVARQWHAYERLLARDVAPRKVIYNSWEATTFDVTAAGQLALADVAASLGVETFVVDDGWFVGRHDDHGGLGDWTPDPAKFPDGFGAFVAAVREKGLEFGLWVEPEMVNPKSALYAAHPEWVYQSAGRDKTTIRNQYLLDLGREDVFRFVRDTLDGLLTEYPISYLKWDFNRPRTEADRGVADLDGAHVRNLYRVLEFLREKHPAVTIEGCAAGGARVDLAMAARTDVLWPSDNTAPLDRLRIQWGFLSAHAPHLMSSWVTDAPGMFDDRTRSLAFRFVLACAGVLGIGADITRWSAAERAEAAEWIERYKQVRAIIMSGEVHRIGSPDSSRCAIQYTLDNRVVVCAWNAAGIDGRDAVPARDIRIPLRGLDPSAHYRPRSPRLDPSAHYRPRSPRLDPSAHDRPGAPRLDPADQYRLRSPRLDLPGNAVLHPPVPVPVPVPAAGVQDVGAVYSGAHLMAVGLPIRWTPTYDADLIDLERL
ncbi:alpha-galactosidase [Actinoplanes sp. TRM 88003]|uniref:alpha-galactosidase n=1 Tax=Paractinoplanes aksuensis TaxID=2939490 RepID=A0ABT1DI16_9ACTN|nr:alpha-galactosidase [Actinoplanes aksuensis]MCO8270148.1 alpha-galactosidase [Actinoplanes aksuensis]